ncbi:MAG: hypothetical protein DME42_11475, partial [Verrucomicrobia bacterium]
MLRAAPLGWQLAILHRVLKQKIAATESVETESFRAARNALTFAPGCSSWGMQSPPVSRTHSLSFQEGFVKITLPLSGIFAVML